MDNPFFKTGDIAKLHNVSTDTVRLYDKEGLVKPSLVRENKYRYYTLQEVMNFGNVTMFRELDHSISSIKKRLDFSTIDEVVSLNHNQMSHLSKEIKQLEKKMAYLQTLNEHLHSFLEAPNTIQLIENPFLFICRGMEFSWGKNGISLSSSYEDEGVAELFWTRTSLISRNYHKQPDQTVRTTMYCSNIINSDCEAAEKIKIKRALRYNYVGNPFEHTDYMQEIDQQIDSYCQEQQLTISQEKYEVFLICLLDENHSENCYIHILYPLI
ncbi:MerR family transcriptional regulator [Paenibacillus sp. M-152]|uniref:MerR family transcriptional regulator n=1 Tax=Paenibacillus sp. M-152 TaxID=2487928 RepID=UPI000F6CD2DD|nr:MerR family transcriptional regulator [Paenibacillus sp. M-152]AZH29514.1 MerR family transcriptional regulator [Paenibacillus sp. M-152]